MRGHLRKFVEINRRIKDVAADGHCLYRAIADQSGSTYAEVRKTCASFMESHESDFAPFIEDASFGDHCAKVRSSADWGGQPELLALARALNRPIVVYSRDSAPLRMGESDGEELVVTYHRDYYALGEHATRRSRLGHKLCVTRRWRMGAVTADSEKRRRKLTVSLNERPGPHEAEERNHLG